MFTHAAASASSSSGSIPQMPVPAAHFAWVGLPSTNKDYQGVPGHDIAGPIEMSELNKKNPLFFWCQDEHVEEYKKIFSEYKNIKVCSFEPLLTKKYEDEEINTIVERIKHLFQKCLPSSGGTIRDQVMVKNAIGLLILCTLGGYRIDTNVIPIDLYKEIFLPYQDKFAAPSLRQRPQQPASLEIWMLYSPEESNSIAKKITSEFLRLYEACEKEVEREQAGHQSKRYYDLARGLVTRAIFPEYKAGNINVWPVGGESDETKLYATSSTLDGYGLMKVYANTHTYENRTQYEPSLYNQAKTNPSEIFYAASHGNTRYLGLLIRYGAKVNERLAFSDPSRLLCVGETPLGMAVRYQQVECVKMLLKAGADLDAEVTYGFGKFSPRGLMQRPEEKHREEYLKILSEWARKLDARASSRKHGPG